MLTIDPKSESVARVHALLLGAIAPRPIAFASTLNEKGQPNLSPFSFFNVFSANPPVVIFSPARRGRDNTTKHTYENVKKVKECVINMVNYDMVHQVSLASSEFPEGINEFEKAGFTAIPSEVVKPFRVKESPVQLECVVKDVIELGSSGAAGNLVICEVVRIHINEEVMDENGKIDPFRMDQVARMGAHWYSRARMGLFEVPKPSEKTGIGVDKIPGDIRHSKILSGNDLGKLGNIETLPDETSVNEYKLLELADLFLTFENDAFALEKELHERAKELLASGNVKEAWMTLLAFNN